MTFTTQERPLTLEEIPVRARKIELLCQKLYSLNIDFSGTSLKKSLVDWEDLSLDEESLKTLNQSQAKISAMKLFSQLEEKASELQKIRREIYSYTVFSEGERVVGETRIGIVLEKINTLYDRAAQLRQELEASKGEGLEDLISSLRDFYSTPAFNMLESKIEEKLDHIRDTFNTEVNPQELLQVKVELDRLKSLSEQIEESTQLSEQIARRQAAINKEAEAQALTRIQEQQQDHLEKFQSEILQSIKEEIAGILATQIENLNNFDPEKNNARIKTKLAQHLERLTTLSEFDLTGSFGEAIQSLEQLKQTMDSHVKGQGQQQLKNQLVLLKQNLNHKLTSINEEETPEIQVDELFYD